MRNNNTNDTAPQHLPKLDDELPIKIEVSAELEEYIPNSYVRLQSVCNKLSAQLNFQTMLVNWYHEEENLLTINIHIVPPQAYQHHLIIKKEEERSVLIEFSDDVFLQQKLTNDPFNIFIAITEKEQQLLNTHVNVCKGLIEKKLIKVINLFADYLSLNKIND